MTSAELNTHETISALRDALTLLNKAQQAADSADLSLTVCTSLSTAIAHARSAMDAIELGL
jgi:hypothetical protein